MTLEKNLNFSFNHKAQTDRLYEIMTSTQIKEAFDSRGEDLKEFIYNIIDILNSTTANSGARNIGFNGDEGIKATNVQDAIELLKKDVIKMALGDIPDGTIEDVKLSDLKGQVKERLLNTINDLNKTKELLSKLEVSYTDNKKDISKKISDIELVLKDKASTDNINLVLGELTKLPTKDKSNFVNAITELFQSANNSLQSVSNGKTSIAGAVGGVTGQSSFQDIANYITYKRNEIGGYLGAGDYANLQRLCDWTAQRKIDLANQLVAKGVGANNQENLGQLVNKVSQIQTGGLISSGDIVWRMSDTYSEGSSIKLEINSLNFRPKVLAFRIGGLAYMKYNEKYWLCSIISIQFPGYPQYTAKTFSFDDLNQKEFITMNVDLNSIENNGFTATVKVAMGATQKGSYIKAQQTFVEWTALA